MVTTVYLVRHGETDSNVQRRFQGQMDIPLNENGRHQGQLLAEALKEHHFDEIFSSRLCRAKETAELIAQYHENLSVNVAEGLEEVDVGDFSGELIDDCALKNPEVYRCMTEDQVHLQYPNGESCRDVYDRMQEAVLALVQQNKGKHIVIVSHGFAIQNFLHYVSGKPFEEMGEYIVANTSHSKFLFEEGQALPKVEYINCHDHLSADDFREWKMKE